MRGKVTLILARVSWRRLARIIYFSTFFHFSYSPNRSYCRASVFSASPSLSLNEIKYFALLFSNSCILACFVHSETMGASRPRHWLLAAVILTVSSSLMASEIQPSGSYSSSVVDVLKKETNRTSLAAIRRRRYVRFPTGSAYFFDSGPPLGRNLGPHPAARFVPQVQFPWQQHKSPWRSPVADYNRPVMAHRTPRLIFRDNDFLQPVGGGAASFFQQSNQLPEFEDDIRGKVPFLSLLRSNCVR